MTIKSFVFNPFQENTYVVYVESGEAMVIDPGCFSVAEEQTLLKFITENSLTIKLVVNTHLHIDHVFGNGFLEKLFDIKALAHREDEFWLNGLEAQARMFGVPLRHAKPSIAHYISEGDILMLGDERFDVFEVPGHSPGSIALYNARQSCLFTGDVLFAGSIGRTDFTGGDHATLIREIHEKIMILPDNTLVYSGHGPSTTIGQEKSGNPFL